MPARGWKDVAIRTWRESGKDNVGLVAAGVAFYGFFGLLSLLAMIVKFARDNLPVKADIKWLLSAGGAIGGNYALGTVTAVKEMVAQALAHLALTTDDYAQIGRRLHELESAVASADSRIAGNYRGQENIKAASGAEIHDHFSFSQVCRRRRISAGKAHVRLCRDRRSH